MTTRTIIRRFLIGIGLTELILFIFSNPGNTALLTTGVMALIMGLTNFCSQCPLFSAITRIFKRSKQQKVIMKRI